MGRMLKPILDQSAEINEPATKNAISQPLAKSKLIAQELTPEPDGYRLTACKGFSFGPGGLEPATRRIQAQIQFVCNFTLVGEQSDPACLQIYLHSNNWSFAN